MPLLLDAVPTRAPQPDVVCIASNVQTVSSSGRPALFLARSPSIDVTVREVEAAHLSPAGFERAMRAIRIVRAYTLAVPLHEDVVRTEDGGVVLEFVVEKTAREIAFVVPNSGAVRYFIARDGEGSRRAGIASDDVGVVGLASWLGNRAEDFPTHGLEVG